MAFPLLKLISVIKQDNPVGWRVLCSILSLIWGTFFMGAVISRYTGAVSPITLLGIAAALSVLVLTGYLFLFLFLPNLYYNILLRLYRWRTSSENTMWGWIVRLFFGKSRDQWLELILKSQEWNRHTHLKSDGIQRGDLFESNAPVVIRREYINNHRWSRERAFAIVLLFNELQLKRFDNKVVLQADLKNQSCAIYNNRGKQFIIDEFLPKTLKGLADYVDLSQKTHEFLQGHSAEAKFPIQVNALRWISGGVLPIARWHGKRWVCLFFRDIYPVGWNIANGASETKDEYKELNRLLYRETLEELVICSGCPHKDAHLKHRLLNIPGIQLVKDLHVPELVRRHDKLREEHDGILLEVEMGSDLQEKSTNHEVHVTFHKNWKENTEKITRNVFIAVNPLELGVEVVKVGEFELRDQDYLIDGEICKSSTGEYLVRQPIAMFSVDYLRDQYRKGNGSLGKRTSQDTKDDRKTLDIIPYGEFRIFTDDILLRRARLRHFENTRNMKCIEAKRLQMWERNASSMFDTFVSGNSGTDLTGNLATFLPTTWKTIELAIEQGAL